VNAACVDPPASGVIASFAEAGLRGCPAGFCAPDLVGTTAVSLGEGSLGGIVFSYRASDTMPVTLGVRGPSTDGSPGGNALGAAIGAGSVPVLISSAPLGFALRFVDCVDARGFGALTFTVSIIDGDIDACPLRFGAQLMAPTPVTLGAAAPLGADGNAATTNVAEGTNTLVLDDSGESPGPTALFGMQWEFAAPGPDPLPCSAYLAIDDIRLAR